MVHAATHPKDAPKNFDFIVLGGGAGGCTVAGRLAENPNVSVLLVEAGVNNPSEITDITTPAKAMGLRNSQYDWKYKTTMIDRPDYTRIEKPNTRGKVLGGSTALNYYTWVRGSAATFNDWEEFGGSTWNWENTKEYFNKSTTYHDDLGLFPDDIKSIGNKGGPVDISHSDLVPELKPWRDALERAWVSKGHELTVDVYNGVQKGLFKCVNSIYKGVRSTAAAFLEGKPNISPWPLQPSPRRLFLRTRLPLVSPLLGPTSANTISTPTVRLSLLRAFTNPPRSSCCPVSVSSPTSRLSASSALLTRSMSAKTSRTTLSCPMSSRSRTVLASITTSFARVRSTMVPFRPTGRITMDPSVRVYWSSSPSPVLTIVWRTTSSIVITRRRTVARTLSVPTASRTLRSTLSPCSPMPSNGTSPLHPLVIT
ncbi:glucose-methanol-choline oxidoreductase [Cryptococcus neoformans]|nr:glucose-methanol-choline oxidoreductase [Cryptococcus neoformans var. grubii]OXC62159.1 glucose-methanol-choline oxidoreductase [Cryptococcus neoformans var. grubii MW-RSA852]